MPINVFNQENSYFMFLIITLGLKYKTMLTIETQKAYNKNNTSCFQENTGISFNFERFEHHLIPDDQLSKSEKILEWP